MELVAPEDGAIGADLPVRESRRGGVSNRDGTADTDAVAAGHWRFEGELGGNVEAGDNPRDAVEHRIRTAGVDDRRRRLSRKPFQVCLKRGGDEPSIAPTSIIGRAVNSLLPQELDKIRLAAEIPPARSSQVEP